MADDVKDKNKEEDERGPSIHTLSKSRVLLNYLVASLWIGPVGTTFWVSTWQLIITVLIFPDHIYVSIWTSFGIAVGVVFIASSLQVPIHRLAHACGDGMGGRVWREAFARVYVYVLAFASVNQWRCFWHGWDEYTSATTANGVATFLVAFFVMALARCTATLMSAPAVTGIDVPLRKLFAISTYFGTEPGTFKHVLDSLFTASFCPFLVATIWRGFWVICDQNLSPNDATISALYCLLIAYGLGGLLLLTRTRWMRLCAWAEHKHWLGRYVVEDVHMFLQLIATISHWRGIWVLMLNHVLLDVTWRYWVGHITAYILMTASLTSKSLLTTGCVRDGVQPNGLGMDLNIYFLSHLLHYWKQKKYNTLDEENYKTEFESTQQAEKTGSSDGGKEERMPVLNNTNMSNNATRYIIK